MHSAPAEVISDPESPIDPGIQPEPPNDDKTRPRKLRGLIGIAVAALVLLLIVITLATRTHQTAPSNQTAQSAASAPGQILRLKGTTEAVQSRAILAPLLSGQSVTTLTVIHLTAAGTRVKQGDLLVEFDRQAQMRDFV